MTRRYRLFLELHAKLGALLRKCGIKVDNEDFYEIPWKQIQRDGEGTKTNLSDLDKDIILGYTLECFQHFRGSGGGSEFNFDELVEGGYFNLDEEDFEKRIDIANYILNNSLYSKLLKDKDEYDELMEHIEARKQDAQESLDSL